MHIKMLSKDDLIAALTRTIHFSNKLYCQDLDIVCALLLKVSETYSCVA